MGAGGAWAKTQDRLESLQQTGMRSLVTCHAGCPWEAMSSMNHIMGLGPTCQRVSCEEWQQGTRESQGRQHVHRVSDLFPCRVPQLMPSSKLGPLLFTSKPCSTQGPRTSLGLFPSSHHLQTPSSASEVPKQPTILLYTLTQSCSLRIDPDSKAIFPPPHH